jgi:hypothetical protein
MHNTILVADEDDNFNVINKWESVTEVDVQTPLEVQAHCCSPSSSLSIRQPPRRRLSSTTATTITAAPPAPPLPSSNHYYHHHSTPLHNLNLDRNYTYARTRAHIHTQARAHTRAQTHNTCPLSPPLSHGQSHRQTSAHDHHHHFASIMTVTPSCPLPAQLAALACFA